MSDTLRSCIIAEAGYTFLSLDASQIELRVLAVLSQDPQMLEDVNSSDLHLATAVRMFGWTEDEEAMNKRRYDAKQGNFALVYDAGEDKLAEMLGCSVEEAREFMSDHRESYPVLHAWMDRTLEQAKEDGFVINMFGRIRALPDLASTNWRVREGAEREVVNTIVQGSAVDIVKLAMLVLRNELLDTRVRMVLQVHDEVLLEVPDDLLGITIEQSKELIHYFPSYPFVAKCGKIYGEMAKVDE